MKMSLTTNQKNNQYLTIQDIEKEILYWNINALNNIASFSSLIHRAQTKQKSNPSDLQIRDFYFTNKLTIDGKFQPDSFLQKSIQYISNFKSLDRNAYLQSVNFQNSLKKYRFWRSIVDSVPKDKQTHQIVWAYRLPSFIVFTSIAYIFMVGVEFTKMKKGKQLAMLLAAMYVADIFIQRRKASQIFYSIPALPVKQLQRGRKELINQSIILDGKIYELDKQIGFESKQLIKQSQMQQHPPMKKALLQAAGLSVLDKLDQVI